METAEPAPNARQTTSHVCQDAQRLLDEFSFAVQALTMLQEQQFVAIVQDDFVANRFDQLIHEANVHRQNAKYAYLTHLESHGCARE